MSEVGTDPVVEPELPLEQPVDNPDQPVEVVAAEGEDVDPTPEAEAAPAAKAAPAPLPKGIADRFKELSEARDRANAERDLYKSMMAAQPKPEEGDGQVRQAPQNMEALVRAEAVKLVAQQELQRKTQGFFKEGRDAYQDFDDRCALIDGLGATDRPEFVQMVTDLPNGARIVAALADEPDEARRILSLSTTSMALALAQKGLSMSASPISKTPISKAPAPARPLQGAARANEEPGDEDSDAAWYAKREKQLAAKRQTR